jgi:hypothetical protein
MKSNSIWRVARTGHRQNVAAQPLRERSHVASQPAGPSLGLPCQFQLNDKPIRAGLAGAIDLDLQLLATRCHTLGEL